MVTVSRRQLISTRPAKVKPIPDKETAPLEQRGVRLNAAVALIIRGDKGKFIKVFPKGRRLMAEKILTEGAF